MIGMSSWHHPDRPAHQDFSALSLSALTSDAQVIEGSARTYAERVTGTNMRFLVERARTESLRIIDVAIGEGISIDDPSSRFNHALICWTTGLNAGLSVSRGTTMSPDTYAPEISSLDLASVNYMSRGRMTMLFDQEGDKGLAELCAAAWFDGCIIGSAFDENMAEIQPQ